MAVLGPITEHREAPSAGKISEELNQMRMHVHHWDAVSGEWIAEFGCTADAAAESGADNLATKRLSGFTSAQSQEWLGMHRPQTVTFAETRSRLPRDERKEPSVRLEVRLTSTLDFLCLLFLGLRLLERFL
jgi:hypothetical protein